MNNYSWNMDYISHHGILNQKWGVRNGPPYPLHGGQYSKAEKQAIYTRRKKRNSIYNKKHFDEVMSAKDTTLSTLSYNKNRLEGADYFYATHNDRDRAKYLAFFNQKIKLDDGTTSYKWKIDNRIAKDMKIASEDSGSEVFRDMFENDRDFYNFVTDSSRLKSYFGTRKLGFRGYRESMAILDKMNDKDYKPTQEELNAVYRLWNYVIPNDGGGNARIAKDVMNQRTKFFNSLKEKGYGAVLDTNDAIYGGYHAKSPIIVFDVIQVIPDKVRMTNVWDQTSSTVVIGVNELIEKVL